MTAMTPLFFALAIAAQQEPDEADRATAATAAGASTFVGVVVGALGTPAVVGIVTLIGFDRASKPDELLLAAVAGGAGGAALGGFAGAASTTTWTGTAAVPAAAAAGALVGLVPASSFGRAVLFEGDASQNTALSVSVFAGIALATGAAAATAAWLAEGDAPPPPRALDEDGAVGPL
jgi:hypothetical protein